MTLSRGGQTPMLQLRPGCECCDRDLPPDSTEAVMCSFECTFCRSCADGVLAWRCPNCGGELVPGPRRPADKLGKFPPRPSASSSPRAARSKQPESSTRQGEGRGATRKCSIPGR